MSRHALGPATGLGSGSVGNVVTGLLADGLVEEADVLGADAGRPRRLLRIRPDSGRLIGVDVGETRARMEPLDLALAELARTARPLGPRGYDVEAVVGQVADGIADGLRTAGLAPGDLLGVGVGVPGIVERPHPVAVAVLAEAAEHLGAGPSDLISLFPPERVLIGGRAGLPLGGAFLDQVRAHAPARALRHPAGRVRMNRGRLDRTR